MKNNKIINILLWVGVALSLVLGVVTVIFALSAQSLPSKIILFLVAVLFAVLTVMVAYLAYMDSLNASGDRIEYIGEETASVKL